MNARFTKILLCFFLLTVTSLTSFSQTVYTLDWASFGWVNGASSGAVSNIGSSGVNCSVSMAITSTTATTAVFGATGGSTGTATPTVSGTAFVVAGSSANSQITMDFGSNADYTDITYTFSSAVTGVKFNVADIDKSTTTSTTYFDKILVSGTNGATTFYPVVSKYAVSSNILGAVAGNSATANTVSGQGGNSASSAADQNGTVIVDFGTTVLKTVTVRYANGAGTDANPAYQAIAIGNMSFQRVNLPPVATNFTNVHMLQGAPATNIPGLVANDADGSIASFTITSLPGASAGTLSCCGGTAITLNQVLTPAQAATLQFDPAYNFSGTASFTFTATDNLGSLSNSATYRLPVSAQAPVANNVMENSMVNTAAATAVQPLNASDVDGTISTYQILTLPSTAQGVLSVPCPTTFTNATCTGGYQDLTAAVLSAYPSGIPLTPAQAAGMRFDPAAGYVGTASFDYNAVDNSGNTSNTANYTIPVAALATNSRPPLANNITAQTINSSLAATSIPNLQATDLDGNVVSYKVLTIPNAATQGTLSCCGGTAITANQVLTPAQAATLQFDPVQTFTGTASFTYSATDNSSLVSNTATYSIPVVNRAPVSTNLYVNVPFNSAATSISPLSGYDADGTVSSYTVTTVPTAAQGTVSIPCPATPTGAACTGGYADLTPAVLTANSNAIALTPAQAAGIRFAPATNFTGTASFAYTSTDDNNNTSAAATYNLSVAAQPPVSADVTNATLSNTAAATTIGALSATDADGTIASYTILTLPPSTQGVLYSGGVAVTVGHVLTPAQAAALQFDPASGFTGVASFAYIATDNAGFTSNTAAYNIPVSGAGNIQPVAKNVTAGSLSNTASATAISALLGTDADGTIASYTITSVPTAAQGTLSIPCPATPSGATCTGGFANLTPAVLAANASGISLTPTQAAALRFAPTAGFTGNVNFTYTTTDNLGGVSYNANYTVPVTGVAPVAKSITANAMSQTASATSITALSATDADGTVSTYHITGLPATSEGVLSVPCPVTLTGATCTGGFQDLTAAVLAIYPGGISLTPTQASSMRFTPASSYTGNVVFNYYVADNSGMTSNLASYTIPVSGLNPLSYDVVSAKMSNGNAAIAISALNSLDGDGTISSYVITSLPATAQGVLSIPCPATPNGATCTGGYANLTAAVLSANAGGIVLTPAQAGGLKFDPAAGYIGNATFNYSAYDNNNNLSNSASYTIPVGSTVTLPLSLLNFSGERNGPDIILNWKTTNETGVERYEIEYSVDGTNFSKGGNAVAQNQTVNNYRYILYNYTASVYYIRLRTVESNGRTAYSNVITIRLNSDGTNSLSLSPNPVANSMTVKINSTAAGDALIRIVNMVGEVVYRQSQRLVKGENVLSIRDLQRTANGSYLLQATVNGEVLSQRFILGK